MYCFIFGRDSNLLAKLLKHPLVIVIHTQFAVHSSSNVLLRKADIWYELSLMCFEIPNLNCTNLATRKVFSKNANLYDLNLQELVSNLPFNYQPTDMKFPGNKQIIPSERNERNELYKLETTI